jgi:hypothetical protein
VRNTLVTYPGDGHNPTKAGLIPDEVQQLLRAAQNVFSLWEGPRSYQVVGGVKAYQAEDG